MAKSQEEMINSIRNDLVDAIMSIEDYQKEAAVTSGKLRHALIVLERLAVDFGRFVNSLPMEARS